MTYMKLTVLIVSILTSISATAASPWTYSAQSIEARLVDQETKKPIEGAVILAHWVLEGGIHVDRVGELVILETVSDEDGRFSFPEWGPVRHWKSSRLTNLDPELIIFKFGYEYRRLINPPTKEAIEGRSDPVRRSHWNQKTIELKRFKGSDVEYAEHVYRLDGNLDRIRDGEDCEWKKTPRMLLAVHRAGAYFRTKGVRLRASQIGARIRSATEVGNQETCGSAVEFFGSDLP